MTPEPTARVLHAHDLPKLIAEVLGLLGCEVVPEIRWSARDARLEVRVPTLTDALAIVGTYVEQPKDGTPLQGRLTSDGDLVWRGPLKVRHTYRLELVVGWRPQRDTANWPLTVRDLAPTLVAFPATRGFLAGVMA